MEKNVSPQKVFAFILLMFFAIIAVTISKYVASNVAEKKTLEETLEEIEQPKENTQTVDIGVPLIDVEQAKLQLRSLYVDIRPQEEYDFSHIRGSVHITSFTPEKYPEIEHIILVHKGEGDEQENESLLSLIKSIPETFETKVLDGGYPSWILSDGPIINRPDPDNLVDVAKMNPVEPRDLSPLIEAEGWEETIAVIDTRSASLFNKSHIPGAINYPFGSLEEKRRQIPVQKDIYVYGTTDREGFDSAVRLFDLGFVGVKTIRGGFNAWKEFGYPTSLNTQDDTESRDANQTRDQARE